jgi:hypothetical protein
MLFMFAMSRTYYLKENSRIKPISDNLLKQLTVCMDFRFDCYTYRAPKMGLSELPKKCENYLLEISKFKSIYEKEFPELKVEDEELNNDNKYKSLEPNIVEEEPKKPEEKKVNPFSILLSRVKEPEQ